MNNARREGTLYGDSWKKDVNEAFIAAKVNGLPQNENFKDLFTEFTVVDRNPLPGFRRFDFAAARSHHPTFKTGVLYAIPLRDSNKVAQKLEGGTTIYPEPGVLLSHAVISRLLEEAIEDELDERGILNDELVLGGIVRDIAPEWKITRGKIVRSLHNVSDKSRFILFHGDEILESFTVNHGDVTETTPLGHALNLAEEKIPKYFPGISALDAQKLVTLHEVDAAGVSMMEHISSIKYNYTARLYDVSGEPDGWGFFGIPVS